MEEKELWMNKLKEKLGDYSEPLPASGWEQLEKELMPPVERKIYPYRKWTVAAAAVILLALGSSVSLYFLGTPAADEIRHAKTPALASVPDVLPDAQQPDMTELGSGIPSYMSRVSMVSVSNGLLSIPNDQQLVFEDGVPYLRQANQVVDMEHHQPISFGLSVRKSLAKGFSVETGLTYTLLSSDAKFADSDQKTEQKLHYLGIPLKANWNFLDKKLFTLYVSGGGMIEKCVYGKLGTEKETVKPLQFSVSGAVGAQFNATKRVGIYVEPGVAYFFDDGSDVQTIRKENPFNFNIQAGIRLTY